MRAIELVVGLLLVLFILWEAFETIVLPRSVRRQLRLTRIFYRVTWLGWSSVARLFPAGLKEVILGVYGPLSLPFLLSLWAAGLILGFAFVHASLGHAAFVSGVSGGFGTRLYYSGTTFFTLGLGDVTPAGSTERLVTVIEAGVGFGFLALVISYLPILYQSFSRREVNISLLDARAGSPPSAVALLSRNKETISGTLFERWETWTAELLESHLSYPVLAYFRSQHERQSWLSGLTTVLDACALIMTGLEGIPKAQAQFTFAIARHALVDLGQVFYVTPVPCDRLSEADFVGLVSALGKAGFEFEDLENAKQRLTEVRAAYEPVANALSEQFLLDLPAWLPSGEPDNWETSPWGNFTGFVDITS